MPFIRLIIPLAVGITSYTAVGTGSIITLISLALASRILLSYAGTITRFRFRAVTGLTVNLLLFSFGWLLMAVHDIRNHPRWYGLRNGESYIARIHSEGKKSYGRITHTAEMLMVKHRNVWRPSRGLLQVSIRSDNLLNPGSLIAFTVHPAVIINRKGSTFNYKAYMARQQIHHVVDLKAAEFFVLLKTGPPDDLVTRARRAILSILDKRFGDDGIRGMAKALLTGYRAELDQGTVRSYTNTGVIHVIAISGMHLGLIYGILHLLLRPFTGSRRLKLLGSALILFALWFFTLICGATPSVTRSAVMFSGLLLGDLLKTGNHPLNALASSAFMLLTYDPMLLWDLGFQLSYAAVAGLVIYNPWFSRLYSPTNGLLLLAWNSIATSLAAQVLTTPLILVNFGQFPVLFILSNIVAVPMSGIILILLILLCLFNPIGHVAAMLAGIAETCIRFMNLRVEQLSSLPFALLENIHWTWLDVSMAYLATLALSQYVSTRKPSYILFFLLTILTWLSLDRYSSL